MKQTGKLRPSSPKRPTGHASSHTPSYSPFYTASNTPFHVPSQDSLHNTINTTYQHILVKNHFTPPPPITPSPPLLNTLKIVNTSVPLKYENHLPSIRPENPSTATHTVMIPPALLVVVPVIQPSKVDSKQRNHPKYYLLMPQILRDIWLQWRNNR